MHQIKFFSCAALAFLLSSCGGHHTVVSPKPSPKKIVTREQKYAAIDATTPDERRKKKIELVKDRRYRKEQHNKKFEELSFAELKEAKDALMEEGNKVIALRYVERMLLIGEDLEELKELRLDSADLNFELGNLEKAEDEYNDFIQFYPSSQMAEYAAYKAILSCFYQTLEPAHDQTKTKTALQLARSFINNSFSTYLDDVRVIEHQCTAQLFESEVGVFNFYLRQNKLPAAEQRLLAIKEQFPLESLLPQILDLECTLAQKQGNDELLAEKKLELAQLKLVTPTMPQVAQMELPRKKYVAQF